MKTCTFYFATVEESDYEVIEPVNQFRRDPLGKGPEYCCEDMEDAIERRTLSVSSNGVRLMRWSGSSVDKYIKFCPFCGARIVLKPHLKLKEVEELRTEAVHHYEVV